MMRLKLVLLGFLILTFAVNNIFAQDRLIFALDLIRHGDRTPTGALPKVPHEWPEGLGQLTAQGMQQEFQLGTEMRKKYVEQYHLLSTHYVSKEIFVRSTDFDRTLMSAESFLMGLYPLGTGPESALPGAYQPIPIHTRPLKEENMLIPDLDIKKFYQLMKQYVFSRADWREKNTALQPNFAHWSEITGVKITDLFGLESLSGLKSLGDILYVYQVHHVPFPEGLTQKEAEDIINTSHWTMVTAFKPVEVGQATGQELLSFIVDYLQKSIQQSDPLKYVLLSAHDSSILMLMSAMRVPLDEVPPYASILNFAVFESRPQNYYIKITFNGQPVFIPACGSTTCSLRQLSSIPVALTLK